MDSFEKGDDNVELNNLASKCGWIASKCVRITSNFGWIALKKV
jgi:hypothetical protein